MIKHTSHWLFLCFCTLAIALLLTGCDLFGGGSGTTTPTPTPTTSLTTYTGGGYTISYPQNWKVQKASNRVTFNDPNGIAYLTIATVTNTNGLIPSSTLLNASLEVFKSQAKNYKTVDVPATTTLAGDTWNQGAATGDIKPSGQSSTANVKIVVITDNHPANSPSTQAFEIGYATGTQVFDLANSAYFQPMLQSFKFTS